MYILKVGEFEGPMELLLALIEKRKLDITGLSLAKITEEYLDYIAGEHEVPLENLAAFLSVAAQLLLIKSKSLLPFLTLEEDEEEAIEDLEFRLREYKKFKDAALVLKTLFEKKQSSYGRTGNQDQVAFFYPPSNVDAMILRERFVALLSDIPVFEALDEEILEEVVTLEERILALREMFAKRTASSFREVVQDAESRMDIIVSFLALLELVKQRSVHVEQEALFMDIQLRHRQEEISV